MAQAPAVAESGEWQRHVEARYAGVGLDGRSGTGRWSTRNGFPVLYLGRPRRSVIVEAYRHIIDPLEFDDPDTRARFLGLLARALLTCAIDVTNLLDLRTALGRAQACLSLTDLTSATTDHEAYARCQKVAQVAHQLRRHGIVAPAATGMGETLALFMDVLPNAERPHQSRPDELWGRLPEDPRQARPHLRVVET